MINTTDFFFISYVVLSGVISCFLDSFFNLKNADAFFDYYSILIIVSVSLYSILFNEKTAAQLFRRQLIVGFTIGVVASVVFEKLEKGNFYFAFERLSWNGKEGVFATALMTLLSVVIGAVLWYTKRFIVERFK